MAKKHRMNKFYYMRHLGRDLSFVFLSILLAFFLYKTGFIAHFLDSTGFFKPLSAFIAGMFFTFTFTVVPAGVALVNVSKFMHPLLVAFFGALGAVCIDMLILRFVRNGLVVDMNGLVRTTFRHHLLKIFHFGFLKWVAFISGMFMLATPLPDEPGLFIMSISKVHPRFLPLIFFLAHFMGIFTIISVAGAL